MAGSVWPALVAGARAKASEVEAKFDWIENDIVPMTGGTRTDAAYDLGTSSHRFRDAYLSRQLILPAGSAGTPGIVQVGTSNGLYFPTTSQIAATNPFLLANGAVGAPSVGFVNSPTTGFYRVGADNIALASAGVKSWNVTAAGEITTPLQPVFLATWSATSTSLTVNGTANTLTASWSEIYDQNEDFSGGVFTAPVTGKYLFSFNSVYDITGGLGSNNWCLFTTARTYSTRGVSGAVTATPSLKTESTTFTVIAPMTAGDTSYVYFLGSTNTTTSALALRGQENTAVLTSTAFATFLSGALFA